MRSLRLTTLGLACFLCGTTVGVKIDVVGEIFLLEPLLVLLALQCILSRGLGKGFVAPVFFGFMAAGFATLCGYLVADLLAANEPWQYVKGWGRVILLVVDSATLMLLVAQDRRHIWWLVLGMGAGGIATLLVEGVPITQWKLGYGEYAAMLVLALTPLVSARMAMLIVAGFGVACFVADYRGLGAVCLIVPAFMLGRSNADRAAGRIWKGSVAILVGIVAVASLLSLTQAQYAERRLESNVGRYVGLLVAWRAISESPLLGYGSWAADEKYTRMLRDEVARLSDDPTRRLDPGKSLLPHSQLLQAWVEGGLLGIAFFLVFGWQLLVTLRWLAFERKPDRLTLLFGFLIVTGLWNLAAGPFLGFMRIYIAMTVGVIAVCALERRVSAQPNRLSIRGSWTG